VLVRQPEGAVMAWREHDVEVELAGAAGVFRYVRRVGRVAQFDPQLQRGAMRQRNPRYVLRNHLGEQAIAAAKQGDFAPLHQLLRVLETPFEDHPQDAALAGFPPHWASSIEISCSS
jgi:uncharacterized protein YdiU (UPF0061 family)